jgi:hypothetical protein
MYITTSGEAAAIATLLRYPIVMVGLKDKKTSWGTVVPNANLFISYSSSILGQGNGTWIILTDMAGDDPLERGHAATSANDVAVILQELIQEIKQMSDQNQINIDQLRADVQSLKDDFTTLAQRISTANTNAQGSTNLAAVQQEVAALHDFAVATHQQVQSIGQSPTLGVTVPGQATVGGGAGDTVTGGGADTTAGGAGASPVSGGGAPTPTAPPVVNPTP